MKTIVVANPRRSPRRSRTVTAGASKTAMKIATSTYKRICRSTQSSRSPRPAPMTTPTTVKMVARGTWCSFAARAIRRGRLSDCPDPLDVASV